MTESFKDTKKKYEDIRKKYKEKNLLIISPDGKSDAFRMMKN